MHLPQRIRLGLGFGQQPRRLFSSNSNSSNEASTNHRIEVPWLVGSAPSASLGVNLRTAVSPHAPQSLSLWGALKLRNYEQMGRDFATKHLKDYDFNTQFKIDAARSASAFIAALDGLGSPVPEDRDDAESLLAHICAPSLAAKYIASTKQLDALNLRANFKLIPKSSSSSQSQSTSTSTSSSIIPSTTSTAIDLPKSPSSKALLASDPRFASLPPIPSHISSWHWIFGPCPPPPDHLYQHWLNFYTLVIPQDVSTLMEYHELKDIKNRAIDEGIFVRIYVSFDVNVAVTLSDVRTGIPVYKDVRKGFDLQVTSPHYTPWDEVLEPFAPGAGVEMGQGSFWKPNQRTEEWRLKWDWRVCDVDYLTYVPVGHSVNLWGGGGGSKQ